MFTVCPKCALTLVVTATDLRIAQGYVRCGRCLNVFNALARLSEDRPATPPADAIGTPAGPAVEPPAETPAPPPPESLPEAEDTGEIEIELDAESVLVTSVRAPTTSVEAMQRETPHYEPGPSAPLSSASEPVPAAPAASEADAQPSSATPPPAALPSAAPPPAASSHAALSPAEPKPASPAQAPEAQQTNTSEEQPEGAFELATPRPRASFAWTLGAGALAIALALQVINHYRDALAANPWLTRPLSAVYSALGVKIAPRWNISAYDVRQLGASVTGAAAGEIVVRASVKNSAGRAQPLPLLRVTLQDRFGNRIAARDVPPGDYLPSSVAPSALLAAGGRVDATMVFVDPGPQAVGFEIDACLRQQSGAVACAHGP
jgi:predicted Zn finger-like uncharacterized protein